LFYSRPTICQFAIELHAQQTKKVIVAETTLEKASTEKEPAHKIERQK